MYKNVTLEVSLKPFKQTDPGSIRRVCREIFTQWRPLVKDCETVSVMLWTADGSEMLDYAGEPEEAFEWCRYLGTANLPYNDTGDDSVSLHERKYAYMENPPEMTYRILRTIVRSLKEAGEALLPGKKILVGNTFDIGPEFAVSDFKYNRHPEICAGSSRIDGKGFVDCTALLHADSRRYAAYPEGIPEGEPIGLFLGRQCDCFLRDMEMDFVWFSNGFGFSADPWKLQGKVFDGKEFHMEKLEMTRQKVFSFWKSFRRGCPDYPVQVRGTNNSVGIDYATDGVPLYEIYRGGFNITPPPNSPWAAINDNYGLEVMGHMTRICELPGDGFLFRFYIHDPWWCNTPWYDRYGGKPHDIYIPMAVSRINGQGRVETAENLNLLSIDNSFGDMPDSCVNEPITHLLKAKKDAGDAPAPLVWVYPMREYSTAGDPETIAEMYSGDTYICEAINNSLPLNCVVSTDNFLQTDLAVYRESVLISPVPVTREVKDKLASFIASGGRALFYGSSGRLGDVADLRAETVDTAESPENIRKALKVFGYLIDFCRYEPDKKTTAMTWARSDNALWLSAYNQTTALDLFLKFPQGAPVFIGADAIMEGGAAKYRFGRSEHLECRVFVEQSGGVVSAREVAPVNKKYRRKFAVTGLRDATVCYYPETYCKTAAAVGPVVGDDTPILDDRFRLVEDPDLGTFYRGEHITGDYYFYMPFPEYLLPKEGE